MTEMGSNEELEKFQSHPEDINNDNMQHKIVDVCKFETKAQKEIATSEKDTGTSCMVSFQCLLLKFKTNKVFREKMIYVICLFTSKFILGWNKGLFGPSYIDIRMISGSNLEQGSWILTANLIGFALGSISQGFLYGRVNNKILYGMASCVYCTAVILVPWCTLFEAMVFDFIVIGLMHGILASGTSTDIIRLWGKESRVVFLGSQMVMGLGNAVAPLVVAPFLVELQQRTNIVNISSNIANVSSSTPLYGADNYSEAYIPHPNSHQSQIYIPFSITSVIFLLSGIFFFVLYAKYDKKQTGRHTTFDGFQKQRKVPKNVKLFIFSLFGSILFVFNGVDEVFIGFLATYCAQFFHWSKKDGALISFLIFLLVFISRIFGIVLEKWMNTIVYAVINSVLLWLSIAGMLVISLYNFGTLAWFFAPLFGFARSCLFPLIFSWTNEYITPITGRISSFYYTAMMLGGALNPILIGHLMEHIGLIWFCYVLLIESFLILIVIGILVASTRYVVRHHGRPIYHTTDKQTEQL